MQVTRRSGGSQPPQLPHGVCGTWHSGANVQGPCRLPGKFQGRQSCSSSVLTAGCTKSIVDGAGAVQRVVGDDIVIGAKLACALYPKPSAQHVRALGVQQKMIAWVYAFTAMTQLRKLR